MRSTTESMIAKPLTVQGYQISREEVRRIVNTLANVPKRFQTMDLVSVTPQRTDKPVWFAQEVLNRLFQRWRKLGLVEFERARWTMTRGAWDKFQNGWCHTPAQDPSS